MAYKKRLLKSNNVPCAKAADPLSHDDINKIKKYFSTLDMTKPNNLRNYTMLFIGISFGLRCGDLISLQTKTVFNNGSPVDSFYLYEQKTNKRKLVVVNEQAKELLIRYYNNFYPTIDNSYYLFPSRKKQIGHITIKSFDNILKKIKEESGMDSHVNFSSHSMRKCASQILFEKGKSLSEIQLFLNHENISTTRKYIKLNDRIAKELYDTIDF